MDTVFRLYWVLTVYLYLSFYVRQALQGYLLSIYTQFFSVRTITNCKFHSKPKQRSLSVFLITYFTVIQTDNYIFHISTLFTSSAGLRITQLMMSSYSPEVVETLIHGQCYKYCFLYCVSNIFSFRFIAEALDSKGILTLKGTYYVSHGMR